MRNLVGLLFFVLSIAASAQESQFCEELEARVFKYIDENNRCVSDSDCAIYTHCPFGCYRPMSQGSEENVESMFKTYGQLCSQCVYGCVAKGYRKGEEKPEVKCISNKCQWTDELD